jgi:hypothetical protein
LKAACLLFLVSMSAAAKAPGIVINCDPADAKHCKSTIIGGRPMRELVHEGTSVAVGKPVATAEGDYRIFVQVRQVGPGKAQVRPKDFSALYSDPAHTRFAFYDKAAEINQRIREANRAQQTNGGDELDNPRRPAGSGAGQSTGGSSKAAKLGRLRKPDPNEVAGRQDEATGSRQSAPQAGTIVTPEELYLSQSTLRRGDFAEGFVYFKKPRRSKVRVGLNDPLCEINIPVNGVVFRFK